MIKNKKKVFVIGLASGAALSFLIALTVFILYDPPRPYELPSLAEGSPRVPEISVYDFALPDELQRFLAPRPGYFRQTGEPWKEEDSREFWVDSRELAASVLTRQNRQKLDEIFGNVP
jgi:hypothetical protein